AGIVGGLAVSAGDAGITAGASCNGDQGCYCKESGLHVVPPVELFVLRHCSGRCRQLKRATTTVTLSEPPSSLARRTSSLQAVVGQLVKDAGSAEVAAAVPDVGHEEIGAIAVRHGQGGSHSAQRGSPAGRRIDGGVGLDQGGLEGVQHAGLLRTVELEDPPEG